VVIKPLRKIAMSNNPSKPGARGGANDAFSALHRPRARNKPFARGLIVSSQHCARARVGAFAALVRRGYNAYLAHQSFSGLIEPRV
jgi:hypothetical protein